MRSSAAAAAICGVHYEAWLQTLGLEDQVAMHHASSTGLLSAVRSGFGIAVLPCIVADARARPDPLPAAARRPWPRRCGC